MSGDELVRVYGVTWSILALIGGVILLFFRKWFLSSNQRTFFNLYRRTNFVIFKRQGEEMAKPYMNLLVTFLGLLFIIVGVLILIGRIKL